jgi:2-desacetyl-2-hydroxyethyl bacteriochlorophyllide A dehydrogenase
MRAFVITGPRQGGVVDVAEPAPGPGQVVVDVEAVGVCGTDLELFAGTMPYLADGLAAYPLRPGHEWAGTVAAVGAGVGADWVGVRVTGDTMLGCGRCARCRSGRHHVCADRFEIGIRGGWPGALAERLPVPAGALRRLPAGMPASTGALVEPGGCALRAVDAAGARAGRRLLVYGTGTLGLLAAQFALARGAVVEVVGLVAASLELARRLGVNAAHGADEPLGGGYDAVIDATNSPAVPASILRQVEPAGRVVLVGLAERPSVADLREVVLNDLTVVGILGASAGLDGAIELLAGGRVQTQPLIAATVSLDEVADVLGGSRLGRDGPAPKVQVDPRR